MEMVLSFLFNKASRLGGTKYARTRTHTHTSARLHTTTHRPATHVALRVLITVFLLHNVTDKKNSDDQINTSRLFSSDNELLPQLTMAPSSLRAAAVREAVSA